MGSLLDYGIEHLHHKLLLGAGQLAYLLYLLLQFSPHRSPMLKQNLILRQYWAAAVRHGSAMVEIGVVDVAGSVSAVSFNTTAGRLSAALLCLITSEQFDITARVRVNRFLRLVGYEFVEQVLMLMDNFFEAVEYEGEYAA